FHLLSCLSCSSLPCAAQISSLSLHDALPISGRLIKFIFEFFRQSNCDKNAIVSIVLEFIFFPSSNKVIADPLIGSQNGNSRCSRSEEHTSELQSRFELVCRLLLVQKKETGQT